MSESKSSSKRKQSTSTGKSRPGPVRKAELQQDLASLELELNHLRSIFRETADAYQRRIEGDIAQLTEPMRDALDGGGIRPSRAKQKTLHEMITLIREVQVRPQRGRRRELKKIEDLLQELQRLAEKWQWS